MECSSSFYDLNTLHIQTSPSNRCCSEWSFLTKAAGDKLVPLDSGNCMEKTTLDMQSRLSARDVIYNWR